MFIIIIFTRIFWVLHCRHGKVHASGSRRDCSLEVNLAHVRRLDSLREALQRKQRPRQLSTRRRNRGKDVPAKSMGRGVFTKARIARFLCIPSKNVCIFIVCKVEWLIPPQNRDRSMYKHSVLWKTAEKGNLCETWSLTSLCNLKIQCHLAAFSQPSLLNRPSANPRLGVATTLLKLRKGPPDQCFVPKIHFLLGNKKMKVTW